MGLAELKPRCQQFLSGGSRNSSFLKAVEENLFLCPFLLLEATYVPLLIAPFLHLHSLQHCSSLCLSSVETHLLTRPLLPFSLLWTLVITLEPEDNLTVLKSVYW